MSDRMRFYLVQRLQRRMYPAADAVGIDRSFALEYMGSSEFEWGAIPRALKQMRHEPVSVQCVPLTIKSVTRDVFIIAHQGRHADSAAALQAWGDGNDYRPGFWGKESSHFDYQYFGTEHPHDHTVAWWSIEDAVAFALTADVADTLAAAFNERPKVKR